MARFEYKAVRKDEFESGVIKAGSEEEVREKLAKTGFRVVSVSLKRSGLMLALSKMTETKGKMTGKEKVLFTEQLASMLKAGLPLIEALDAFVDQKGKVKGLSKVVGEIIKRIQTGKNFSDVLGDFPGIFPASYVAVVKSGEASGTLGEGLEYLAMQLRRENELGGRVKAAMIYPMVVLTAMVTVLVFIMVTVVPKVVEFASNSGVELPFFTLAMVATVKFLIRFWPLIILGIIAVLVLVVMFSRSEPGAKFLSRFWIRLPFIGNLVKNYNQARFARLLGGFYRHGVSVVGSFDILEESLGNRVYKETCKRIKGKLVVGQTLADALEDEEELFPPIMHRLVKGAERTGALGTTLDRLAKYYEDDLEVALKNVTVLIEPMMVILLGIGVVGIALSVIVPIYRVSTGIK